MTEKQIEAAKKLLPPFRDRTPEQNLLDTELSCREMINSCLAYSEKHNFYDAEKKEFGKYAQIFLEEIGEKRVMCIWNKQLEDFSKATVIRGVYTDNEGCTYNTVKWADD